MKPTVAITELERLKGEAAEPLSLRPTQSFASWRSRAESVLSRSLGSAHHITKQFREIRYSLGMWSSATPKSRFEEAFVGGIKEALGYIDAAIYELRLFAGGDEPLDERTYDPGLWQHVQGLVEVEDWAKVASQTAIFVEDRLRSWAANPKDRNGNDLHGKDLLVTVLGDPSVYRLGRRKSEIEGWRSLGVGFIQALGNVDRHQIQSRDDARRYAIGVLGVGSLLLTQMKYEHGDIIEEE